MSNVGIALRSAIGKIEDALNDLDFAEDKKTPPVDPNIVRLAMERCEPCAGIPELSINRCPVCRTLQAAL